LNEAESFTYTEPITYTESFTYTEPELNINETENIFDYNEYTVNESQEMQLDSTDSDDDFWQHSIN
jgi:hypothetical protein